MIGPLDIGRASQHPTGCVGDPAYLPLKKDPMMSRSYLESRDQAVVFGRKPDQNGQPVRLLARESMHQCITGVKHVFN